MHLFHNRIKFAPRKLIVRFLVILTFALSAKIYSLYFDKLDFGDEFDNFVGSWLIAKGHVPYRDFFSHHFPLLFFIGAPLEFISHAKFLYRLLMFIFTFGSFIFFFRYLEGVYKYTILPFILLASFGISLYGGQQFADGSIWAFILTAAFFLVLKHDGYPFSKNDTILFTILFVLLLLTSPIHLVALPLLVLLHVWLQFRNNHKLKFKLNIENVKLAIAVTLILLALFLIYLIFTKSLNDFFLNAFSFNSNVYFFRTSKLVTGIEPLDVYLNAIHEIYIHFFLLLKNEGLALVTFLKAAKFLVLPFSIGSDYINYAKIIFEDLYNNFFSIQMIVALFYTLGMVRFYLNKRLDYVILLLMFLLPLRLRIDTNTHLAPFYFFSYWLNSFAFIYSISELLQKKRLLVNMVLCFGSLALATLFVTKHWYNFNQTAFNTFPRGNVRTVNILKLSDADTKVFIFRDFSASYYYESGMEPYGYFTNYFPWYSESERLKDKLIQNLQSYDGDYLVVNKKEWDNFKDKHILSWRNEYFRIIDTRFKISGSNNEDYIFAKK